MSDETNRETAAALRVDARMNGGPRVTDPAFVPKRPPSDMARNLMKSFADRLSLETLTHARALLGAIEQAIIELRAGRFEGFAFCMSDLEHASAMIGETVNKAGTPVREAIDVLDPQYARELEPAYREGKISRLVAQGMETPLALLEVAARMQSPGTSEAEAVRRLLIIKKGNR